MIQALLSKYKYSPLITVIIFMILVTASASPAQEPIATYPILPYGYSSIKIFDNQRRFAGRILPETRYWVPIERIPDFLQKAVVAVEDARFYEHGGIDVRGIARALVKDVVKGRLAEGGSTITQQLIKNRYLTGAKTVGRKLEEASMAIDFEKKYTKKQILEMYLNEIYFGNGAWGIAQAARLYFDKNPEELSDAECSLLAGVPKNPGRYNPLGDAARITARRDVVLARMVAVGMITPSRKNALRAHPASFIPPNQAPYYISNIKSRLIEKYGAGIVKQGGLDVISAMDLNLQKVAEKALADGVKRRSPGLQGALLSMDPSTGDVLAAVGGVDSVKIPFNRAFAARRQPGSSIKPLIYAAALENGVTAGSLWDDTPVSYNKGNNQIWKPRNYAGEQFGTLSLSQALAYSNNVITVKLLESITVPYFVEFAKQAGLPLKAENGLSLALGTEEVTLSELVSSYTPFANGGLRAEPRVMTSIYDRNRKVWNEIPVVINPAFSSAAAYITTSMLKGVMTYGTAKSLAKFFQKHPSAGKTGTTDDYRDAWFVGYTPRVVTGVWVGYDKPRPGGKGFTGGVVAAPIWEKYMRAAVAARPSDDFKQPDSIIALLVDAESGQLATSECPEVVEELFISGTEPTEQCSNHGGEPDSSFSNLSGSRQ